MTAAPRPSDKYIPLYFVAFFVAQFILFGTFAYIAKTTHTGLVTDEAYQKGLDYNKTIKMAEVQEKLGYTSEIRKEGEDILFILRDHEGSGIAGATVKLFFFRPSYAGMDFSLSMQDMGAGTYKAVYSLPENGLWELRVHATTAQGAYQTSKRMVLE